MQRNLVMLRSLGLTMLALLAVQGTNLNSADDRLPTPIGEEDGVPARIRFSDEDLQSFYDKHRERLFVTPPRVRVKAIIAPSAKLAEEARRKAVNGEDIDELIAEYFVPYFAEHRKQKYLDKQVDFGWVDQNEFWRGDKRTGPLWGLKVGELSKPHPHPATGSTYAVLKIVAKRDAATASLKEVQDNVYSHLWDELADTSMFQEIRLGKSPLCGMCRAKRNANGQLWNRAQHYIERGDSRKAVSACLLALREDRLDPHYGGPKPNEKGLYPEEQYLVDHGMDLARYYLGAMDRAQRGQRVHLPDWISSRAALIKDKRIVPAMIRLVANRGRWCQNAAHGLATIKADSAIPVLKDMLSDRHLCIVELYWGGKEAVFAQYYLRARARHELRRMGIDPGEVKVVVGAVEGDRLPEDWANPRGEAPNGDQTSWGKVLNGLQCRAWVDTKEIPIGSDLHVNYELRNVGNSEIRVLRDNGYPHHVHIEWLDRNVQCSCEHKPPFTGDRIGAERFVTLRPGDTFQGRCSWWGRIESEHTEAAPRKASLRVMYFIFPEITKRYPDVWGPAPGQTDALRVRSNIVQVSLEPGLPGSRGRREGGYSLEDALLMADLMVQARVESKPKAEKLVEFGYREDETREVLLRRSVRLTLGRRLGGREKAGPADGVLTADYVTDPRRERALEVGEQVIAFLIRQPSGGGGWILFKAVPSADPIPALAGKQVGQFGPALGGIKCLLAGPRGPVSRAKPVKFAVLPRFDPESADPSTKYLDRHYEDYQVVIHFENAKTGKTYTRRQNWEGGPPLMASRDQRRTLASDPLPPTYVRVRLLNDKGEAIPPGEYRVTAEYSGGRPEGLDASWKKNAWRGQVRSAPITLQVVSAEPFVEEVRLPTKLVLTRSPDGIRAAYSHVDMKTLKLPRRSGYHLGTLTWVKIYKGDKQVAAPSQGCQGGVPSPSSGGEYVFGGLSLLPVNREALRVVVEMEVFETCQTWSHGWAAHEDPNIYKVLWKGTVEGTVAAACKPDAPKGEWGEEVNGLRSRLLLDRKSCAFGEPVWIYLDVRNESDAPIHVARSPSMLRWFRITGPNGKRIEPIEDVWGDEDFYTDSLEPDKERTPTQMSTVSYYQWTVPGTYRVQWLGVPAGAVKEGTTPPPAPAVEFDVLPGTARNVNWGKPVDGLQAGIRFKALVEKPTLRVVLVLHLRNAGTKPIRILRLLRRADYWGDHLPLEVKAGGVVLKYQGSVLEPPEPPSVDDYVDLAAGATESIEVTMKPELWGLEDPRRASIAFVFTNRSKKDIAYPYDDATESWTEVTGLWTGTARSGTVTLDGVETKGKDAPKPAVQPYKDRLPTTSLRLELHPRDRAPRGLYAIDRARGAADSAALPNLFREAAGGKIGQGCTELVGCFEAAFSEGDEFEVAEFSRIGNRIMAEVRYIRRIPEGKYDRNCYVRAPVAPGLPPGRYYVLIRLTEYLREGNKLIFAPRNKIRKHGYLTCFFDVPVKDTKASETGVIPCHPWFCGGFG